MRGERRWPCCTRFYPSRRRKASDPTSSSVAKAHVQRRDFVGHSELVRSFMPSESVRQMMMRAEGEHDGGQTTGSSCLHIPFTRGHPRKNSIKSDKRGNNASDTTLYMEHLSLSSSAASIKSSITQGSSTSIDDPSSIKLRICFLVYL